MRDEYGRFVKGTSGNLNGAPTKLVTQLARDTATNTTQAMHAMVEALPDATDNLIAMARGISVLHILDVTGQHRALSAGQAKELAKQPAVVEAGLLSGQAKVFVYAPDLDAIKVLMDRVMGKVPSVVEVELKPQIAQAHADHAELAMIIREHVPEEYLGPIITTLERIARRGAQADRQHAEEAAAV